MIEINPNWKWANAILAMRAFAERLREDAERIKRGKSNGK